MPNGGKMDCKYTEEMRVAIANYYKEIEGSESYEFEVSVNMTPEESEINSTYTIDGKVAENPLQKTLDNGQCVVSGY